MPCTMPMTTTPIFYVLNLTKTRISSPGPPSIRLPGYAIGLLMRPRQEHQTSRRWGKLSGMDDPGYSTPRDGRDCSATMGGHCCEPSTACLIGFLVGDQSYGSFYSKHIGWDCRTCWDVAYRDGAEDSTASGSFIFHLSPFNQTSNVFTHSPFASGNPRKYVYSQGTRRVKRQRPGERWARGRFMSLQMPRLSQGKQLPLPYYLHYKPSN